MSVGAGAAGVNPFMGTPPIGSADVKAAAGRIGHLIRPVTMLAADPGPFDRTSLYLACESTQVTGSFEARGAANFALYYQEHGALLEAGVVVAASGGGNSGLACAWAARETDSRATVFVPAHSSQQVVRRLHDLGAEVHRTDGDAAQAARAAAEHAELTGALLSHAYDNPLIAVGAGTLAAEINDLVGADIDTIVLPVGGGALLAGACAALEHTGIRIVPVEPQRSRTLSAALEAGFPVEVPAAGLAADSLDARRVSQLALDLARTAGCLQPVQVTDEEIYQARQTLWEQRRLVAEYGAATALAAIQSGAYVPDVYERVVVVLSGANTDPTALVR
jgi:threonine dehydratase